MPDMSKGSIVVGTVFFCPRGCNALRFGENWPVIWRTVLLPSSELGSTPTASVV